MRFSSAAQRSAWAGASRSIPRRASWRASRACISDSGLAERCDRDGLVVQLALAAGRRGRDLAVRIEAHVGAVGRYAVEHGLDFLLGALAERGTAPAATDRDHQRGVRA